VTVRSHQPSKGRPLGEERRISASIFQNWWDRLLEQGTLHESVSGHGAIIRTILVVCLSNRIVHLGGKSLGLLDPGFRGELDTAAKKLAETGFFDPEDIADARERTLTSIVRRQGQPVFRQRLLDAYGRRCAITDCNIEEALEAAHIIPYSGPSTNHPNNGLLLRADLHTLFDLGLVAVHAESMEIIVAPAISNSPYEEFNGRPLRLPLQHTDRPSREALERHRQASGLSKHCCGSAR
jgi:hypothetical protein